MHYFAYGSNMSVRRLQQRVPSAQVVSVAVLAAHSLQFHKISRDGSAKCDAMQSEHSRDLVHGVVYSLDPIHKPLLDAKEGLGNGYDLKTVSVLTSDGQSISAFLYYATHTDPQLKPYDWYKTHVLRGAREHGLPPDYIDKIASVASIADPDLQRHRDELAIYD